MLNLYEINREAVVIGITLEVLTATIAGMLLGAFWYSPIAFGEAWMKCIGRSKETMGSMTRPMLGSIVANLLLASAVVLFMNSLVVISFSGAILLGAVLGGLVIFPALLSDNLFCGWGIRLLLIQAGYRVLAPILMAVVVWWV